MNDRNYAISLASIVVSSWLLFSALRTAGNSAFAYNPMASNFLVMGISIIIAFAAYRFKKHFQNSNQVSSSAENVAMLAFVLWSLISLIVFVFTLRYIG
ncbi:hypothetical protein [Deinococcus malanensis]|uniref:hypothetical protein n=1 Tax=Deinococcus malanensis TaxID=1706855 RepID=UPI001663B2A8|nr:hypothetical protein [Deinococcus malanensis]